jgi:hypothetical protein
VVSVVSPVVAGERRRGRGYHEHSGKQQNQDLLHFCSSNSSLMDLSRNFHFESPSGQQHTQISILDSQPHDSSIVGTPGLFTIAHFGGIRQILHECTGAIALKAPVGWVNACEGDLSTV